MFYLITGTPGAGKTLLTIAELSKITDRKIYYHDINLTDFGREKLGWTPIDQIGIIKWRELPPNSIVLIDECHKIFPVRSAKDRPQEWVEALAEHRHLGIDFYLLTQHPMDIDVFVRRRIYQHIHYKRQFGYESCSCFRWEGLGDPDDKWRVKDASVKRISYPKEFYEYYISSQKHTVKKEVPKQFWYMFLGVLIVIGLAFFSYSILFRSNNSIQEGAGAADAQGSSAPAPAPQVPVSVNAVPTVSHSVSHFSKGVAVPSFFYDVSKIFSDGFINNSGSFKTFYVAILKDGSKIRLNSDLISKSGGTITLIDNDCFHSIVFDNISFDTTCAPLDDAVPNKQVDFSDGSALASNDVVTNDIVSKSHKTQSQQAQQSQQAAQQSQQAYTYSMTSLPVPKY